MQNELYDSVIFICKLRRLIHHTLMNDGSLLILICVGTIIRGYYYR